MKRARKEELSLGVLQAVIAVCESGSMSVAAKRLRMTQSAVSQAIQQAERVVGVALFDRARRPLKPTHAGQTLRGRATGLLRELEALPHAINVTHSVPELRLALIDSFSNTAGPHFVRAAFEVAHHLYIAQGLNRPLVEALIDRRADVIVSADMLEDLDGIERHPLMREPLVMLVPEALVGSGNRPTLLELHRRLPLVRYTAGSVTGAIIDRYLRRVGAYSGRRLEVDNALLMCDLVASGAGWAVTTPLHMLQGKAHLGGVTVLPLPESAPAREITLVVRAGEFEAIAPRLAQEARRILREDCVPAIIRLAPWLKTQLEVF